MAIPTPITQEAADSSPCRPRLSFFRELQGIGKRKNRYAGVMRYVSFD